MIMENKKCNKCGETKSVCDFAYRDKKNGILKNNCKTCDKNARKIYYQKNKGNIIEGIYTTKLKNKIRNQQFVWDYLKTHPCIDCGETNPIVLEFDHKDNVEKHNNISFLIEKAWSIKTISDEIDKCDVRCANCHRIRTSIQFNWYGKINK
jgi:hypothetical protein